MQRALELARRGIAVSSPNPAVGCVILDRAGQVAGEGWHEYDLVEHAEVVALKVAAQHAGNRLLGGTAYVTLEPCNHTGRTGPCTDALIASLIYPSVLLTLVSGLMFFMFAVVVPQFAVLYDQMGSKLPAMTMDLLSFGKFLRHYIVWILLAMVGTAFGGYRFSITDKAVSYTHLDVYKRQLGKCHKKTKIISTTVTTTSMIVSCALLIVR